MKFSDKSVYNSFTAEVTSNANAKLLPSSPTNVDDIRGRWHTNAAPLEVHPFKMSPVDPGLRFVASNPKLGTSSGLKKMV